MTDETPPSQPAPMDVHKPKPGRDWRELLTELAIVVVGVGLALAAQQAADWWRWRSQVQEAQAMIMVELTQNMVQGIQRMNGLTCIEHRLDGLADILDKAAQTGRLPAIGFMDTITGNVWPTAAWSTVIASQAAAHFSPERIAQFARIYGRVESAGEIRRRELDAWTDLYSMAGPGRRLDPVSENTLRVALGRVRSLNREMASMGRFVTRDITALGLPFTKAAIGDIEEARKSTMAPAKCIAQPGGNFDRYGQGIFNTGLPGIEAARTAPLNLNHGDE